MNHERSELQHVLAKVHKLRRLAASSTSVHEAETAAVQADALLQKYRFVEADMEAADPSRAAPVGEAVLSHIAGARMPRWKEALGGVLAKHYGCGIYRSSRSTWHPRKTTELELRLVGTPNDVKMVLAMWAWITVEIVRLATQRVRGCARVPITMSSYCLGAVAGYRDALRRAQVRSDPRTSGAIVLAKRHDAIEQHMAAAAVKKARKRSYSVRDEEAFGAGYRAGEKLPTGAKELPGQAKLLET